MTASIYSLSTSTMIADLVAGLTAKGLITTNYYQTTGYLIFSTPITSKVIKVYYQGSGGQVTMYYGDAWTSGSTITNQVQFMNCYTGVAIMNLIADPTWLFIGIETGSNAYYTFGYVGALDNGDVLVFGLGSQGNAAYLTGNIGYDITQGVQVQPIGPNRIVKDADGHVYSMPLYWLRTTDNVLILNGSSPAATLGVKCATVKPGSTSVDKGSGYYISATSLQDASASTQLVDALLVEYTP